MKGQLFAYLTFLNVMAKNAGMEIGSVYCVVQVLEHGAMLRSYSGELVIVQRGDYDIRRNPRGKR